MTYVFILKIDKPWHIGTNQPWLILYIYYVGRHNFCFLAFAAKITFWGVKRRSPFFVTVLIARSPTYHFPSTIP